MKKRDKWKSKLCILGIGVILFIMLWHLNRVHTVNQSAGEARTNLKRITFISPVRWEGTARGLQDAGEKFGFDIRNITFSSTDGKKLAETVKGAIYADVDGIITGGGMESEELYQAISLAKERGIPLVLIDTDIPDSDRLCYIGTDNYQAGWQAGLEFIQAANGEKRNVAVLVSDLDSDNQRERLAGFEAAVAEEDQISITKVVEGESDSYLIKTKVMELLQEYPDINGFYCAEGFSSATVGKVLEELQTDRQFTIVCFGIPDRVEDYIESGMYAASLLQDTYGMGANAAEYLYDYLNGRGAQTDAIYTDMIVVRKENLQDADNMEGPQGDEIIWQIY